MESVRMSQTDTLITKDHPEKAKNKPLIRGKCKGQKVKLFLDTGAEINVIDRAFYEEIQRSTR